ncbi:hypothetical protein [Moorena sp. SIO3H5]|nr:hypothetical protein [Moorena sp. SIO3H5]
MLIRSSLLPTPYSLLPAPCSLFPLLLIVSNPKSYLFQSNSFK